MIRLGSGSSGCGRTSSRPFDQRAENTPQWDVCGRKGDSASALESEDGLSVTSPIGNLSFSGQAGWVCDGRFGAVASPEPDAGTGGDLWPRRIPYPSIRQLVACTPRPLQSRYTSSIRRRNAEFCKAKAVPAEQGLDVAYVPTSGNRWERAGARGRLQRQGRLGMLPKGN